MEVGGRKESGVVHDENMSGFNRSKMGKDCLIE